MDIFDLLRNQTFMLPPNELRQAAKQAHALAADLERKAENKERAAKHRASSKRHYEKIRDLKMIIAGYIFEGKSEDQAIILTHKQTGLDVDHLRAHLPLARKHLKRKTQKSRNRQIMQLARQGRTDSEIGQVVDLHPKSVNRIISELWEKAS